MIHNCQHIPVITIDGPSGVGKGEISWRLAEKLNWHILDSGAVYRALAFLIIDQHLSLDNVECLVNKAKDLALRFVKRHGTVPQVVLAGDDVTQKIRYEEYTKIASHIAAVAQIREALIDLQRNCRQLPGLIADGRDMGTKIFPDAKLKVFLTADSAIRAKRRFLQLQDQGINANLSTVLKETIERDKRDQTRTISPLKPDVAAMIVDTSKLTINEVLQRILVHVT